MLSRKLKSRSGYLLASIIVLTMSFAVGLSQATAQSSQISCDEIAVIGSVKTPGRLKANGTVRLNEVLTKAGGPSSRAGRVVRVHHFCSCSRCSESDAQNSKDAEYDLPATLQGRENANPFVQVGDLVIVPEAEFVSVIGNVLRQQTFRYREGVTVTKAIALAGGPGKSSDLVRVKIHRLGPAGRYSEIIVVNLGEIVQGRMADPLLRVFDTVEVSNEQGRFFSDGPIRLSPPIWDPPLFPRKSSNC